MFQLNILNFVLRLHPAARSATFHVHPGDSARPLAQHLRLCRGEGRPRLQEHCQTKRISRILKTYCTHCLKGTETQKFHVFVFLMLSLAKSNEFFNLHKTEKRCNTIISFYVFALLKIDRFLKLNNLT